MNIELKQTTSLEKIRLSDGLDFREVKQKTLLRGERYSYQIAIKSDERMILKLKKAEGGLYDFTKVFIVQNAPMDCPVRGGADDGGYITTEPMLMPDILVPIEENPYLGAGYYTNSVWVRVDIPKDFPAGKYTVEIIFEKFDYSGGTRVGFEPLAFSKKMEIEVLPYELPEHNMFYTQWFHVDCIADYYKTGVYSERHWELIESFMKTAVDTGINMILVPLITPPLDTAVGMTRTCVQLVDITKNGDTYTFGFAKLIRYIKMAKRLGIKYFEMSHLFSQWGSRSAPNIKAAVDGEEKYIFGWHVPANDPAYIDFLKTLLPPVIDILKAEGIDKNTYFHISDEPTLDNIDAYKRAYDILKPVISGMKTFDALSNYEFYKQKLVEYPVVATDRIKPFLENKVKNLCAYYCSGQYEKVSNRFLAMPSYRNRILGLQLYKYDIKGFLQWGFNYYNGTCSVFRINPFLTTSAAGAYPSGDAFTVYPGENGPLPSVRAEVFYDALQDLRYCTALEGFIGREKVVSLIEEKAGMAIEFDEYPQNADFLLDLRETLVGELKENISKK